MKRFVFALCFFFAATVSASAQEKITASTLFQSRVTAAGQPIVFPKSHSEVTALMVDIPAGTDTGWHKHPWPRYAYVVSGVITVENDAGKAKTYRAGEFFVEQINIFHHGTTTVPTRLLVIDQDVAGKGNQINRPQR
ncbi:MAG TPA: cupin domain-containing protein [Stellaceae bacterium]|jgi:quercetin dioxygenase-like cupin family protein|nr:cupin domain-containing protein [Stellaceae bacterium]